MDVVGGAGGGTVDGVFHDPTTMMAPFFSSIKCMLCLF